MAQEGLTRWAVSTNIPTWAALGTANAQADYAISRRWTLLAGAKYNPFTYKSGTPAQFQLRQAEVHLGTRYWFDTLWEGWFAAAKMLGALYNVANILGSGCFEGELAGLAVTGGYNLPLGENTAIGLGAGAALAAHHTTYYAAARCGRITGKKQGLVVFPCDIMLSLMIKL